MATPVTLDGVTYQIPDSGEGPPNQSNWSPEVNGFIQAVADLLNGIGIKVGSQGVPRWSGTSTTLAAGATLTPTHAIHRVEGSGGAVSLGAVTAIADGDEDRQLLVLIGSDATNTVTVPDGANTDLAGTCVLGNHQALALIWDATDSVWVEITRTPRTTDIYVDVTKPPFNATGDGTTDDAVAIQAALDLGKTTFFPTPAVKYKTTVPLEFSGDIVCADGVIIESTAATALRAKDNTTALYTRLKIGGFQITATASGAVGLETKGVSQSTFHDIRVVAQTGASIAYKHEGRAAGDSPYYNQFFNCGSVGSGSGGGSKGHHFTGASAAEGANDNQIYGGRHSNHDIPIHVAVGSGNEFFGATSESAHVAHVRVGDAGFAANGNGFFGCYHEGASGSNPRIYDFGANAAHNKAIFPYQTGNGTGSVVDAGTNNVVLGVFNSPGAGTNKWGTAHYEIANAWKFTAGILVGADCNLYRAAADKLKTDDALDVAGKLTALGAMDTTGILTALGLLKADAVVRFTHGSTLTISSGSVTPTGSRHLVDTEGAASSDNLDTISGGTNGDLLLLSIVAGGRSVVLRDVSVGGGNITIPNGELITLSAVNQSVLLERRTLGWCLVGHVGEPSRTHIGAGFLNLGTPTTLTIASGAVTATQTRHTIAAESGTADDLDTINGGEEGDVVVIGPDTGDTITVTESGNIVLTGTTRVLDAVADRLTLLRGGSSWTEIAFQGG